MIISKVLTLKKTFTIIIFTEGHVGLIVRIASMISRRLMHIKNMHLVTTQLHGAYRFTLEIHDTEEAIRKLMLQINKQVEVFKSFYNTDAEILWQQHDMFVSRINAGNQANNTVNQTPGSAAEIERSVVA